MDLDLKHPVALVPTMGALHAGHASLIEIAKKYCSDVVVSIFVNPLQFENPNDFSSYPKSVDSDVELATTSGATKIWVPTFDEIYPSDPVIIASGAIGNLFEGVHRFGHFDGMLTVVKRLFDLVQPEFALASLIILVWASSQPASHSCQYTEFDSKMLEALSPPFILVS